MARIVQNMNGQLNVESDPNKLTKFSLVLSYKRNIPELFQNLQIQNYLKRKNSDGGTKMDTALEPLAAQNKIYEKLRILYAEVFLIILLIKKDDLVNQGILNKRLTKLGYEITCCENGVECITLFTKDHSAFDIILMDVQMPLCNGLEATKRIREIENSTEIGELPLSHILNRYRIPILATSASVYESDVVNCIQAGMDGFVNKPIDVSVLDRLLKSALDQKEKDRYLMSDVGVRQDLAWFDDRKFRSVRSKTS